MAMFNPLIQLIKNTKYDLHILSVYATFAAEAVHLRNLLTPARSLHLMWNQNYLSHFLKPARPYTSAV